MRKGPDVVASPPALSLPGEGPLDAALAAQVARLSHLQRLATTGLLAGGLGHNLASMAQSLSARCRLGLARAAGDPEAAAAALTDVGALADRIVEQVHMLLRYLARDFGSVQPTHVEGVVHWALRFLESGTRDRPPVAIRRHLDGHHVALAERTRLMQALLNVLSNAVRAARAGGGHVEVGVGRRGAEVEIEIRDDGPGIPAPLRARLFEPFVRGAAETEAGAEGSGLGLYISRWLMSELGGRIEFETEEGTGTTFRLLLAHAPSEPEEVTADPGTGAGNPHASR